MVETASIVNILLEIRERLQYQMVELGLFQCITKITEIIYGIA